MISIRKFVVPAVVLTFLGACAQKTTPEKPRDVVLSERKGLRPAPDQKLPIAGDCSAFEGSTGCLSGLCLRVAPGFPPRGVCSQRCGPIDSVPSLPDGGSTPADARVDIDCPVVNGRKWFCLQVMPGRSGLACVPPRLTLDSGFEATAVLDAGGAP